jgi:hypothetical protein
MSGRQSNPNQVCSRKDLIEHELNRFEESERQLAAMKRRDRLDALMKVMPRLSEPSDRPA